MTIDDIRAANKDAAEWLEQQENEFMQPAWDYFTADEAAEFCAEQREPGEEPQEGWYSQLSAPGYMDCTDWFGPYETEVEAVLALYEVFGD